MVQRGMGRRDNLNPATAGRCNANSPSAGNAPSFIRVSRAVLVLDVWAVGLVSSVRLAGMCSGASSKAQ